MTTVMISVWGLNDRPAILGADRVDDQGIVRSDDQDRCRRRAPWLVIEALIV